MLVAIGGFAKLKENFINILELNYFMSQGKEAIRQYTWAIFTLLILGAIVLIGLSLALGTTVNLLQNYSFYISIIAVVISLIGLFKYKKWGFYLISIYFVYLFIQSIVYQSYMQSVILVIFAYFVLYKGFYKNIDSFD